MTKVAVVALIGVMLGALPTVAVRAARVAPAYDPAKVDLVSAITCKLTASEYNGFAANIGDDDGIAKARGWVAVKSANVMFNEYRLPAPITVAGTKTNRIGFSSSGIAAILDMADPTALGITEGIENKSGPAAVATLAADLHLTREQVRALPVTKMFIGERVVSDTTAFDTDANFTVKTRITQSIKTARSYLGKTLYGCGYSMELTPGKIGN